MYVVVYSQEMVVKVRKGDGDYVKHAVRFFTDFPPVVITVIRVTNIPLLPHVLVLVYFSDNICIH